MDGMRKRCMQEARGECRTCKGCMKGVAPSPIVMLAVLLRRIGEDESDDEEERRRATERVHEPGRRRRVRMPRLLKYFDKRVKI